MTTETEKPTYDLHVAIMNVETGEASNEVKSWLLSALFHALTPEQQQEARNNYFNSWADHYGNNR